MDNSVGGMIQKLFDASDSLREFEERRKVSERFLIVNASPFLQSIITESSCDDENNDKSAPLSDKLRTEGNKLFQGGQFRQAAEKFTEAAMKVMSIKIHKSQNM